MGFRVQGVGGPMIMANDKDSMDIEKIWEGRTPRLVSMCVICFVATPNYAFDQYFLLEVVIESCQSANE